MFNKDQTVRSADDVKGSLMFRAFTEGRLDDMIRIIDELEERVRDAARAVEFMIGDFDVENFGQPQAIRALNLLARYEGAGVRFTYESGIPVTRPAGAERTFDA